jgi:cell division inhibitor SepF
MSMKNKIKNFFYLEEEEDTVEASSKPANLPNEQLAPKSRQKKERKVVEVETQRPPQQQPRNVVSIQTANSLKNSKVVIVEPRVYAEAQDISEHLKNKRAIIVNLQRIDR